TLDISEAASRQLLHRATEHVAANRPRFKASRETHQRLLSAFMAAASQGDVAAISSVLAEDVVLYGDNAGKPGAVIRPPLVGREKVARFFAARIAKWPPSPAPDVESPARAGRPHPPPARRPEKSGPLLRSADREMAPIARARRRSHRRERLARDRRPERRGGHPRSKTRSTQ